MPLIVPRAGRKVGGSSRSHCRSRGLVEAEVARGRKEAGLRIQSCLAA